MNWTDELLKEGLHGGTKGFSRHTTAVVHVPSHPYPSVPAPSITRSPARPMINRHRGSTTTQVSWLPMHQTFVFHRHSSYLTSCSQTRNGTGVTLAHILTTVSLPGSTPHESLLSTSTCSTTRKAGLLWCSTQATLVSTFRPTPPEACLEQHHNGQDLWTSWTTQHTNAEQKSGILSKAVSRHRIHLLTMRRCATDRENLIPDGSEC